MPRPVLIGLLVALAAGCATSRQVAVRTLTEADDGQTVEVRVGDVLAVHLRTSAATGYAWEVADAGAVVLQREAGPDYAADPASAGMAGAGGVASWRFRALQPGAATLRFAYRRPWEGGPPAETRTYRVVVRGARGPG